MFPTTAIFTLFVNSSIVYKVTTVSEHSNDAQIVIQTLYLVLSALARLILIFSVIERYYYPIEHCWRQASYLKLILSTDSCVQVS